MANPFGPPDPFDLRSSHSQDAQSANPFGPAVNPFAQPEAERSTEPPTSQSEGIRRYFVIIGVVVLLLSVVGVGGWALLGSRDQATPSPTRTASSPAPDKPVPSGPASTPSSPGASPSEDPATGVAGLLNSVTVVPELPNVSGYDRSCSPDRGCVFGPAWKDVERTGCDTRNRVLASQLRRVEFKPGTRDCKVVSGVLNDPYSGTSIDFTSANPRAIEIDHVFALARAWDAGASSWPLDKRVEFANDTENLLAVSGDLNQSKSDSGPDTWLPPNASYACPYITKYLRVAAKWQLAITDGDRSAALSACG